MSAYLHQKPRDLPIALAHRFAEAKPGDPVLEVLNRLYRNLKPSDKLRCRAELHECRAAKRGERVS